MAARRMGVVLLALCGLLLLALPRARTVPGEPRALPPPPPPVAGDCLRVSPEFVTMDWDQAAGHDPDALPLAACTGLRYGEVVQVRRDGIPAAFFTEVPDLGAQTRWLTAAGQTCAAQARAYVGLPTFDSGGWEVAAPVVTFFLRPLREQVAAGQRWLACVATLAGPTPLDPPLAGFLLRAQARDGFGSCASAPVNGVPVSCTTPHTAELFGTRSWSAAAVPTATELRRSCLALLSALVGRADVTVGGQLSPSLAILNFPAGGGPVATGFRAGVPGSATCGLTSTRPLAGALLLLRDQPVPWT